MPRVTSVILNSTRYEGKDSGEPADRRIED
jgi:hypothetical protein